jgi:hypothetical protein
MIMNRKRAFSRVGLWRGIGIIALAVSALSVTVPSANASVPVSWCNGKSYKKVVRTYTRGTGHYPLRCGTSSWGFHHITHRWNASFDAKIALTIARGEDVADVQQDGGSNIFALFNNKCQELFRVIYNGHAYRGNGIRPQGIITAYDRSVISTALPEGAKVAPVYRTDCGVTQGI